MADEILTQVALAKYYSFQYMVLTGVGPIYDECKWPAVQKKVKRGVTPFLDPRWREHSFAEGEIMDAVKLCWEYDSKKRITAAELVRKLRVSVQRNRELLQQGLTNLPSNLPQNNNAIKTVQTDSRNNNSTG